MHTCTHGFTIICSQIADNVKLYRAVVDGKEARIPIEVNSQLNYVNPKAHKAYGILFCSLRCRLPHHDDRYSCFGVSHNISSDCNLNHFGTAPSQTTAKEAAGSDASTTSYI